MGKVGTFHRTALLFLILSTMDRQILRSDSRNTVVGVTRRHKHNYIHWLVKNGYLRGMIVFEGNKSIVVYKYTDKALKLFRKLHKALGEVIEGEVQNIR